MNIFVVKVDIETLQEMFKPPPPHPALIWILTFHPVQPSK